MQKKFQPKCLPMLIGSLPLKDHNQAAETIFKYTPEIPLWAQLPVYPQERILPQFFQGMPGIVADNDKEFVDTKSDTFSDAIMAFYEEYLAVTENKTDIEQTRFTLTTNEAQGFFTFLDFLKKNSGKQIAVKGQVVGPITFTTALKDKQGSALIYDDQAADAAVKLLALKAKFQAKKLAENKVPVIIFVDDPGITGFGTSQFISISREKIKDALNEVIQAIHSEGAFAGIHVCANTDWALVMECDVDIVNFDAYSYFDKFIIYKDALTKFIQSGGIIAWGVAPTHSEDLIQKETTESIITNWKKQAAAVCELGIDMKTLSAQSLITPSCGLGTLSIESAVKVLELTRKTADFLRKEMF